MTRLDLNEIIGESIWSKAVSEEKQVSYKMFLPEPLRARFKSVCALKGVSMNQVLIQLVEEWIEKSEKLHHQSKRY